ncbi:SET domain containing protein [Acanthamoeba castellanii str. Neff]|uniref:SET domain containing protein n=1 Tax=Acanthamoeba castellanii (strain ATCC 30010 / Neff) TaxID=1257118 RepID=L8HJA7_ACACF|nr:SET domain containing protein [Acanthamoeba castellanii str. Neff]ELR25275.1 SET domain containing protein [Acanthamoeba castellanii str. Neff]
MKFDERAGKRFSIQARKTAKETSGEYQTTLQQVVLAGDLEAVRKELSLRPGEPLEENNKSILHYAVMTRNTDIVQMLIRESRDKGVALDLNKNDIITGFTPLHYSIFIESRQMLTMLLAEYNADIDVTDAFSATPLDYARMLGMVPHMPSHLIPRSITVYDKAHESVAQWPVAQLEERLTVTYCALPVCGHKYIEELMFSGFGIGETDVEFSVGYGVFAGKDYQPGSYICRYGGRLSAEGTIKNRAYAVVSGVEGMVLDGTHYRNLGGMINHSARYANAELQCFFDRGAEQAVITATQFIPKGKQILLDYSESYWQAEDETTTSTEAEADDKKPAYLMAAAGDAQVQVVEMGGDEPGSFPAFLPSAFVVRLLLNILGVGSQVFGKAFLDAWRQAGLKAKQTGAGLSLAEAQKILGLRPPYELKEVTKRYEQLFKSNDPANGGSFYLQSKVYRARERLEQEFKTNAEWQAKGGGTNAE